MKNRKFWTRIFVVVLAFLLPTPFVFFPALPAWGAYALTVNPASGSPGIQVVATGKFDGYGANDTVMLWWDFASQGRFLGSTPLRPDGTFALPVTIPPDASMGNHPIVADVNFGYASFSQSFQVYQKNRTVRNQAFCPRKDSLILGFSSNSAVVPRRTIFPVSST